MTLIPPEKMRTLAGKGALSTLNINGALSGLGGWQIAEFELNPIMRPYQPHGSGLSTDRPWLTRLALRD
jgi:hypothetical protein